MNSNSTIIEKEYLKKLLMGDFDFHDQTSNYASHNFHSFPAKFPPQLPRKFIEELTSMGDVVLDPMVGSGTTVVEARLMGRKAIGFDIDPLALNIARVKTTPIEKKIIVNTMRMVIYKASSNVNQSSDDLLAQLEAQYDEDTRSFLNTWYLPKTQIELFALAREIEQINEVKLRDFFKVAFSAIIITKSGGVSLALDLGHTRPHLAKKVVDKSGRILIGDKEENIPHYSTKIVRSAFLEFEKKCLANIEGIPSEEDGKFETDIRFSDAQSLPLQNDSIDLIVTSPPYASNAIDYMRAHKFSLVWFGYPIEKLGEKRKDYIGGESVQNFDFETLPTYTQSVIEKIKDKDPKKSIVIHRYYSEMTRVLREMLRVLKPGKASIVVVGNSIIRGIDVDIPNCLSEIGGALGFEVPAIGVRQLDRDKRMLPAGNNLDLSSQIQQRMHEEYLIGFLKTKE